MDAQALIETDNVPYGFADDDRVGELTAIKVWHCYQRRNAWYGHRSVRYFPGSMHLSEESAELFAEQKRNCGTVHYIQELPALRVKGRRHALIVTQINTPTPLRDFVARPLGQERAKPGSTMIGSILRSGIALRKVERAFAPKGPYWRFPQPSKNSLITGYSSANVECVLFRPTESCTCWKAYRQDGHYLGWNEIESRVSPLSVLALQAQTSRSVC